LQECAARGPQDRPKRLCCRFLVSPIALEGDAGRLKRVRVQHAELAPDADGTPRAKPIDRFTTIEADLVLKAVGYRGIELPGLAFDATRGIVANRDGRALQTAGDSDVRTGHYVVGWAKRGPTGLVGTNSPDSKATIELLLEDLRDGKTMSPTPQCETEAALRKNGIDFVTWSDWLRLDAHERSEGETRGKARHKEPSAEALMQAVRALRG
jgi:ferredoxin--NADP+ reductase